MTTALDSGSTTGSVLGAYVYGIVEAAPDRVPADLVGLDGRPVELVEHDGIGAAVGPIDLDRPPSRRADLVAHSEVLERLAEGGPVAPVQFGSVLVDADTVRAELLGPSLDHWRGLLDALRGRAQFNLRATYHEHVVLQEVVGENPEIAALREFTRDLPPDAGYPQRVRQGELVARAVEAKRAHDEDLLLDLVLPHAVSYAVHDRSGVDHLLDVALLVGLDRRRPLALRLIESARRLGFRDDSHRREQHDGRENHAQQRGVTRRAPGEGDALERGEVRQHGEDPERGLEQVQQRARDETDHALRPLHHADRAPHADRLGASLRVAHHHRADEPGHRDDRAARVGNLRVEHDDREQHHQVGVAIDDRVEKGSERRDLAGGAGQRAVEKVAEPGQDQQHTALAEVPGAERRRGQEAHAETDDRQMVGTQVEAAIQREPDRVGPAAQGLSVAAQHRQMG